MHRRIGDRLPCVSLFPVCEELGTESRADALGWYRLWDLRYLFNIIENSER